VTAKAGEPGLAEVVVTLEAPPLARADRGGAERVAAEQSSFRRILDARLPDARITWRYRLVANGFAVVVPAREVQQLRGLPGVRDVYASASYGPQAEASPGDIGAPAVWGPALKTAGQGIKIGIIDSGVDQRHSFFDPTGYSMPAGFPKGQRAYTTAKVIVARAFPPPGASSPYADAPFDPTSSSHGTHVAGIAAGDTGTSAGDGRVVSGVAPKAYIGNYKALTATNSGLSPNGNSPELVAAIEAAVADGMNVINLSLGEPEIDPRRDIVAHALDAAAAMGVVPIVAAGNDADDVGAGSVISPGSAAGAITVGAVTQGAKPKVASFSSIGPTPMSLRLKPDVAAPGVDVLSSVPSGWSELSGTSMATPHVAGAVALLEQRHPSWTVPEIKSALTQTARDARPPQGHGVAGPVFDGGGVMSLPTANQPLLFAVPSSISFGLVARGESIGGKIALADAGGGAGMWNARVTRLEAPRGARLAVSAAVSVPGSLSYRLVTTRASALGDVSGLIVLRRASDTRRIPFWGRIEARFPALSRHRVILLVRQGLHTADTRGQPALVSRYRYPANPRGLGVSSVLAGPETVYLIRIRRRVANFGLVIVRRPRGSRVQPRVVAGMDENRLTGIAALPVDGNPYLSTFHEPVLAAGALLPGIGDYAIVFDSATRAGAGTFTFRYWVNDVTPPTLHLAARTVARGSPVRVTASDSGSGVYPASILASFDGSPARAVFADGVVRISTAGLAPGRHRLRVQVSDHQEAKNDENVAQILPNTRVLKAVVTVRP
jgi:subtilisin family serine protease